MSWNDCLYCGHSESTHTLTRDVQDIASHLMIANFLTCGGTVKMYRNEKTNTGWAGPPMIVESVCDCTEFQSPMDLLKELIEGLDRHGS